MAPDLARGSDVAPDGGHLTDKPTLFDAAQPQVPPKNAGRGQNTVLGPRIIGEMFFNSFGAFGTEYEKNLLSAIQGAREPRKPGSLRRVHEYAVRFPIDLRFQLQRWIVGRDIVPNHHE